MATISIRPVPVDAVEQVELEGHLLVSNDRDGDPGHARDDHRGAVTAVLAVDSPAHPSSSSASAMQTRQLPKAHFLTTSGVTL